MENWWASKQIKESETFKTYMAINIDVMELRDYIYEEQFLGLPEKKRKWWLDLEWERRTDIRENGQRHLR